MRLAFAFLFAIAAMAQDPVATLEGTVRDPSGQVVAQARVVARELNTGAQRSTASGQDGLFRIPVLPVGEYSVTVEAGGFATFEQKPVRLSVSQVVQLQVGLVVAATQQTVVITGDAPAVETVNNVVGKTVSTREILDLPLNGRNFTQLGLLQAGVTAVTSGVATAGGSLRAGQAYSGSRPDLISDPNSGPRAVQQWLPRSAFRRLDPVADAGKFGNAGRNIARGPGMANLDLSLFKTFAVHERAALQLRAECFNVFNHANFLVPVSDLNSANFGRILEAGPARLVQLALKVTF